MKLDRKATEVARAAHQAGKDVLDSWFSWAGPDAVRRRYSSGHPTTHSKHLKAKRKQSRRRNRR